MLVHRRHRGSGTCYSTSCLKQTRTRVLLWRQPSPPRPVSMAALPAAATSVDLLACPSSIFAVKDRAGGFAVRSSRSAGLVRSPSPSPSHPVSQRWRPSAECGQPPSETNTFPPALLPAANPQCTTSCILGVAAEVEVRFLTTRIYGDGPGRWRLGARPGSAPSPTIHVVLASRYGKPLHTPVARRRGLLVLESATLLAAPSRGYPSRTKSCGWGKRPGSPESRLSVSVLFPPPQAYIWDESFQPSYSMIRQYLSNTNESATVSIS